MRQGNAEIRTNSVTLPRQPFSARCRWLPFVVGHTGSVLTSVCARSIQEGGVISVYRVRRTQAEFKEGTSIFKCFSFRSRIGLDILLALAVRATQWRLFLLSRKPATLEGFMESSMINHHTYTAIFLSLHSRINFSFPSHSPILFLFAFSLSR